MVSGPSPGDTFAGHRIESEAGRGGMGVVYRAVDLELDRVVALKLIAPEYAADPEFRDRFKRECRLAASLSHPHVVPIYRAGEEDGLVFVTMAFIEGTDLRALLKSGGALGPRRAVELVGQVASALDAAHSAGLVHRDIKPGNVLIGDGDHAYLTDFGLTKRTDSHTRMTETGTFVGTLDYIAPEQLEGKPVDARADVYSLGCVLYQLLTGEVPFPRNVDTAKMWAHVGEPPPLPTAVAPKLPAKFDEVIARAMAKDPEERYPSAGDLARAAEAAAEGRDPDSPEHSVARGRAAPGGAAKAERVRGGRRRRRAPLVAGAILAAAGLATAAVALSGGEDGPTCTAPGGLGTKERPLRIYSSAALQGPDAASPEAAVTGARMALAEAGGAAGGCVVAFTSLDATTVASGGAPDEKQIKGNARRAARDRSALAYLGDWHSGATAMSLPITNRAGLAQVSASNTDPALTVKAPGVPKGEPERFYPTKRRTYARVIPTAIAMAADIAVAARQSGCSSASVITDPDPYAKTMNALVRRFGSRIGLRMRRPIAIPAEKPDVARVAEAIRRERPSCIMFAAVGNEDTPRLLNELNSAAPNAWIIAGDAIGFPELGATMTAGARVRTRAVMLPLPVVALPQAGRAFFRRLRAEYGSEASDPYAAYGYEAMMLILDAIERANRAGRVDRAAVVKALFATRNRKSILGTYSIDKNGDTSLSDHGMFRPGGTRFAFDRVVRAPRDLNLTLD